MAPILYYIDLSPPVRAVLLTAEAIGLQLKLKEINLFEMEHLTSDFVKINPQHTVPTLIDDGFTIWDSHAINAYLVGKYAEDDSLYPKDLQKRAIVDQRLHFDSGILFPRLRNIFFPILFLGCKEISADKKEEIHQGYAFLNTFLKESEYLAGDQLTIADFSVISSVTTTDLAVTLEDRMYPNLTRWVKKMKTLPYYQKANGSGINNVIEKLNKHKM